ncbi:MAG: hypothetical protein ACPL3C_07465 [Pyrobaculum sp.]
MRCFCGRPALESGYCPYHDPNCVRDKRCRRSLAFTPDCEGCNLPGGEVFDSAPRLRGAKIHGPLIVQYVVGDVDLTEARGADLYIHSVRGAVRLGGSRFRNIYIDTVEGGVDLTGARAVGVVLWSVKGSVAAGGLSAGGHVSVIDAAGPVALSGAKIAGELIVEGVRGTLQAGASAYSISIYKLKGEASLSGASTEGDIRIVESQGERLDLSGVEVGGRVYILASKFGGVRVDRQEVLKKLVVL